MTTPPISRLQLERYCLGRLTEAERQALDAHARTDPELQDRLTRLQRELAAAEVDLPPLSLPQATSGPALQVVSTPPQRAPRRGWMWGAAAVALAAVATLVVLPSGSTPPQETFRGSFDLQMQQVRHGSATEVGALVHAREGDRLQLTVTPSASGWLTIAQVQDDGVVSLWQRPRELEAGAPHQAAVVLDDYTGSERVFVVLADDPIGQDRIERAVEEAARPVADVDALPHLTGTQKSVLIVREPGAASP